VLQQVGAEKGRSVPGGRVFPHAVGFEEKSRRQVILASARFGTEEVDQRREPFGSQRGEGREIEPAPRERLEPAQRTRMAEVPAETF
jgi:hypothetical protein